MGVVIYSANVGGYDKFIEPTFYDKNVRYILFTDDKNLKSKVWEVCHTDFLNKNYDNRKIARYIKLHPHKVLPSHDVSIWIDNNLIPNMKNVKTVLSTLYFKNHNLMLYKHRIRNCIYDEGVAVLNLKKERKEIVDSQLNKYRNEGFPSKYGLYETGFMIRKNNDIVNEFNEYWWDEINNGSGRDQLSQMYVSWKLNFDISQIPIGKSAYENPFLIPKLHLKELKY